MAFDRSLRTTFNEAARLYDEVRPGYPEQLVEDVLSLSGIPQDGRILEIGCGPGKATIPFARRGYSMLCLELGKDLALLAAENCRLYPGVEIQNVAFEDWPLQSRCFDLVISAQAFHWIPPEIGYAKASASLRDSGSIALFWNHYPDLDTAFSRALDEVYKYTAPQLAGSPKTMPPEELVKRTVEAINASALFGEVVVRRYPWSEQYTADQYIKLLNTYSDHLNLAEDNRRDLFTGVGEVIERFGGIVDRPYLAVLYFARVKASRLPPGSGSREG
jgi:SAM-dependent methyltransferase